MKSYIIFIDYMNKYLCNLLSAMLAALAIIVFMQVLTRNYLPFNINWSEEVSRYILIWIGFLGTGVAIRRGHLVNFDMVVALLPQTLKKLTEKIMYFLSISFLCIVIYSGMQLVQLGAIQMASSIPVSKAVIYAAVPVGGLVMLLNLTANMLAGEGG